MIEMVSEVDPEAVLSELKEALPALSSWAYVGIWAVSDMLRRFKQTPQNLAFREITFPHSKVPLFTPEQAASLETAFRQIVPTEAQVGGAIGPADAAQRIGTAIGTALDNPSLFSIDKQFEGLTSTLDTLDESISDFSKQYGLVALESVAPDPKFLIPLGPVPIPVSIPARIVLPVFNTILELVRVASTLFPPISLLGKPTSLLLTMLDLARGNLYNAIFSFLGMWGTYPMYTGILLKILRDAYVLISPDIRTELRDTLYKSTKSMTAGFVMWMFSVVAPEMVRRPLVQLLDKVRLLIESFNDAMTKAEVKMAADLKGFGSIELPKMPSSRIPSIGDLYILQEYLHHPRVFCDPEVVALLKELQTIPPMVLFFDLLSIPAPGTPKFEEACAASAPTSPFVSSPLSVK